MGDELRRRHWRVEVFADGEQLVAIEPEMLAGKADLTGDDLSTISNCAEHLLGFVGTPRAPIAPPEGFRLVPVEPTSEMLEALVEEYDRAPRAGCAQRAYDALLAATPESIADLSAYR